MHLKRYNAYRLRLARVRDRVRFKILLVFKFIFFHGKLFSVEFQLFKSISERNMCSTDWKIFKFHLRNFHFQKTTNTLHVKFQLSHTILKIIPHPLVHNWPTTNMHFSTKIKSVYPPAYCKHMQTHRLTGSLSPDSF